VGGRPPPGASAIGHGGPVSFRPVRAIQFVSTENTVIVTSITLLIILVLIHTTHCRTVDRRRKKYVYSKIGFTVSCAIVNSIHRSIRRHFHDNSGSRSTSVNSTVGKWVTLPYRSSF